MGPKPFPFPLNVGTDICRISRIFRVLAGRRATRFVSRILTPEEIAAAPIARPPLTLPTALAAGYGLREGVDFSTLKKTYPDLWTQATFLAGRFAAKEATFKAHPSMRLSWHDIVIKRAHDVGGTQLDEEERHGEDDEPRSPPNGSGPPIAVIRTGGKSTPGEEQTAMLSISHDGDYATAVCLGYKSR
ncbi:hypothetical protein SODALDRAFT_321961 [Sodiomyces alkalinus F11]|uniref:4'-phosphopantetheinyl transferase domain-containing protein n=1 Tax=Sodiomyces alkalinus (strain CBS 110278 / VKM F-3762 / F11) TaxID=1314773 RepID=A0A3N2Q1K9_SODAK|nr:hypothetical protein SODALDRAFT_321961 [Sodiomyces alkalinus F11]ROT40653.1 hypothetical protein SODALDRAFT_321961 [Sodiomyces alkalinus F11]